MTLRYMRGLVTILLLLPALSVELFRYPGPPTHTERSSRIAPGLRTTNPIESTFATVRLRTQRTKGCGSRIATLTMVFKLGLEAQKHWRRLQGFELITKVVTGVRFVDGEEQTQQAA